MIVYIYLTLILFWILTIIGVGLLISRTTNEDESPRALKLLAIITILLLITYLIGAYVYHIDMNPIHIIKNIIK
tara:strand:- start:378 stop:599 length:222 start_codon:yes stop_codon:yes gene_type:complete